MDQAAARSIRRRHQPSPWLRILGIRTCRIDGQSWPCDPHQLAVAALNEEPERDAARARLHAWMVWAVDTEQARQQAPRANGGRW